MIAMLEIMKALECDPGQEVTVLGQVLRTVGSQNKCIINYCLLLLLMLLP